MSYSLGGASTIKLGLAHPDLQTVVKTAISITDVDFSVVETERSKEQQRINIRNGVSWTMDSDHIPDENGEVKAADIYPWVDGETSHDREHYKRVAKAMFSSAQQHGIKIEWGGFWAGKREDMPHWALT